MSTKADRELASLRAQVRAILLKDGTALAPGSQTPEGIDDLIGAQARRALPTLDATSDAIVARVAGRELAVEVSNHHGTLMATYGDAGYFVGLSAGLELACLDVGRGGSRPDEEPARCATMNRPPTLHDESAEDVVRRATSHLALLIRFAEGEQRGDRGGTNSELDTDAWYAIEDILLTTRRDVQRLDHDVIALQDANRAATRGAR